MSEIGTTYSVKWPSSFEKVVNGFSFFLVDVTAVVPAQCFIEYSCARSPRARRTACVVTLRAAAPMHTDHDKLRLVVQSLAGMNLLFYLVWRYFEWKIQILYSLFTHSNLKTSGKRLKA